MLQLEDVRLSLIEMRSSREFIQAILNLQPNTCLAVVLLIWKWWDVRNEVKQSCHEVAHVVAAMTSDLQKEEKGERDRNCIDTRRCWSPPPSDWLEVNFDGAFCKESKFGSWGFITRD